MISTMKPYLATTDEAVDILNHIYRLCSVNFTYDVVIGDNYEIKCNRTGDTIVRAMWCLRDFDRCLLSFHKDFINI